MAEMTESIARQFPLDRIPAIREHPENFRLEIEIPFMRFAGANQKLPIELGRPSDNPDPLRSMVILSEDIQARDGRMYGLAMLRVSYDRYTSKLVSIDRIWSGLENPPENVRENQELYTTAARKFDDEEVREMFRKEPRTGGVAPFAVSLLPYTERPPFDIRFPELGAVSWVTGGRGFPWAELDEDLPAQFSSMHLLCLNKRVFFNERTPVDRCLALLWFVSMVPGALEHMVQEADSAASTIQVRNCFNQKEELKQRRFRWSGEDRCWSKTVYTEKELQEELEAVRDIMMDPDDRNVRIIESAPWERYRKR
ncbi:hypothetical protein [Succinimonas amylolytica]|uniref:hypothetical protein n=1 Tax=Succinimonas amylolytica TaxID=83769 RepID=UPI0023A89B95